VVIEKPARVTIDRRDEDVLLTLYSPKRSGLCSIVRDSFCDGFGRFRHAIRSQPAPEKGKPAGSVLTQRTTHPNGTNRKQPYETKACDEI
jgi:hypothetical protein